jgi:hypothetical protein
VYGAAAYQACLITCRTSTSAYIGSPPGIPIPQLCTLLHQHQIREGEELGRGLERNAPSPTDLADIKATCYKRGTSERTAWNTNRAGQLEMVTGIKSWVESVPARAPASKMIRSLDGLTIDDGSFFDFVKRVDQRVDALIIFQ